MNCVTFIDMMRFIYFVCVLFSIGFLSACECEEYSCDDDGCYICDSVSCRDVEPPVRNSCVGDFECSTDQLCTDIGCVSSCTADMDCPQGTICKAQLCVGPTEPDPTLKPGSCVATSDCGGSDLICVNGKCQVDTGCDGASCACSDTDSCATGFECISGACRAEDDVCHFSLECGAERVCVDGRCLNECDNERICPASQSCEMGICRDQEQHQCGGVQTCAEGQSCIDEQCFDDCQNDSGCSDGFYCKANACEIDDRPKSFCSSDSECEYVCQEGICRTPCDSHDACLRIDVQFSICAEGYCRTTNEVTSDCELSNECAGEAECIDGICR